VTTLRPDHRELLDRLRDPACPTQAVVVAPPGTGARLPLQIYLAEIAAESLCLVVAANQMLAAQWTTRLEAAGVERVVLLTSASAALPILEGVDVPRNGVIVTTHASVRHRLSGEALSSMEFELAIYDDSPRPPFAEPTEPRLSTRRAITLVDRQEDGWTSPPVIWRMTLRDMVDKGLINATRFFYEEEPHERELRDAAVTALAEYARNNGTPLVLPSDSLPALHSRLLTAATGAHLRDDLADRMWNLLDRMDAFPGPDSRLQALDRVLDGVLASKARCVVMAPTTTDASYIAEHLNGTHRTPRAVISSRMRADDRRSAMASVGRGECVVATPVVTPSERWPENTTVVLWPAPFNDRLLPSLALPGPGVRVVAITDTVGFEPAANSAASRGSRPEASVPGYSSSANTQAVAVLAPTAKGRRLIGSERQALARDVVSRYTAGESIRALAEATGRSYGYIHRILTESGVQLRQRGGARRRKKA